MNMTNEQILSVLSLTENPLIDYADIAFHKNNGFSGSISSVMDADPKQVEELVLSIFPERALNNNDEYEVSRDGSYLYKIKWLHIDGSALSVHFNKKAPVCQQEPKENNFTNDLTINDMSVEEFLQREA